jgi:5'-nucleotidase
MKRRDFVKNTFVVAGGVIVSPSIVTRQAAKQKERKITILHTNDTHSNIDPLPENHPKFPRMGGVERRFEMISEIREAEDHVVLLDAGDIFQGTPYFNMFGGVLEMKVMTALGYDAATMGNHDFDGGMDGFLKAKEYAAFPFVCANYDFSDTVLKDQTTPSVIIEKGGVKIGILGVGVELKGLVPEDKYGSTVYLDPIECANREAEKLKKEGCELIICLSHLGYSFKDEKISDLILAKKTRNIHLIIGGHTHTFLDRPTEEKNLDGELVLINQVGWGGIKLGRLDFIIEKKRFSSKGSFTVQ